MKTRLHSYVRSLSTGLTIALSTVLLVAMALTTATPSVAQADRSTIGPSTAPATVAEASAIDSAATSPRWTERFDDQMEVLLRSSDEERRENAMQLIIKYARDYPELDIDFGSSVRELFGIYNDARATDGERLMALAALQSIGEPYILKRLARNLDTVNSERVRRVTRTVLSGHLAASDAK